MNPEKEKKDRKMATYGSLGIHALLLLLFLFFRLHYMEPKPEDGIPVNFGYQESAGGSEYVEGPNTDSRNESSSASASSSEPVDTGLSRFGIGLVGNWPVADVAVGASGS